MTVTAFAFRVFPTCLGHCVDTIYLVWALEWVAWQHHQWDFWRCFRCAVASVKCSECHSTSLSFLLLLDNRFDCAESVQTCAFIAAIPIACSPVAAIDAFGGFPADWALHAASSSSKSDIWMCPVRSFSSRSQAALTICSCVAAW